MARRITSLRVDIQSPLLAIHNAARWSSLALYSKCRRETARHKYIRALAVDTRQYLLMFRTTSAKSVVFSSSLVCLFVCLFISSITQRLYSTDFYKIR